MASMTRGERTELGSLIRKREKVMKSQAQERSAALMAEFDAQSAKMYHFDDDAVWAKAEQEAKAAVEAANRSIFERCRELGIPEEFAPSVAFNWYSRGHNMAAERRQELRRAAKSKVEALEKEAVTKIERLSYEAQSEIISSGLESDAAKLFLTSMPSMDALMPPIEIGEIQSLIDKKHSDRRLSVGHYDA